MGLRDRTFTPAQMACHRVCELVLAVSICTKKVLGSLDISSAEHWLRGE